MNSMPPAIDIARLFIHLADGEQERTYLTQMHLHKLHYSPGLDCESLLQPKLGARSSRNRPMEEDFEELGL